MWSPQMLLAAQALAHTPGLQQQAHRVLRTSATGREDFLRDVYRNVVKMSKHSSEEWVRHTAFLASGLLLHGAVQLASTPHRVQGGRVQTRRRLRRENGATENSNDWSWVDPSILQAYEVLGLKPGAARAEIEKAYKRLSLKNHPDKGGTPEKQAEIVNAKAVLLPPPFRVPDPDPDPHFPETQPTEMGWVWEKWELTKREWAGKLGRHPDFIVSEAIAALVLAGVVSAAVYYLIWRPCRRRHNEKHQRTVAQQVAKQVHMGMKQASPMADGLPDGRMRKVATLGLQEARHTVTALHQGRPSVISQGLARVVTWSRRALASVVHTVKRVATNAVALVTRFARRWSPCRWWPKT